MEKVAVYPGSFNPLHKGHLAIVRFLLSEMGFDKVRLIVSPHNPLKATADPSSARARFNAAQEAASRVADLAIEVDDIELTMDDPQYTCRTLEALREAHPLESHVLTIGADQLADFRRWRDYGRILTEWGVVAFPREGYDIRAAAQSLREEDPRFRIEIADFEMVNISSSDIRSGAVDRLSNIW